MTKYQLRFSAFRALGFNELETCYLVKGWASEVFRPESYCSKGRKTQ